MKQLDNSSINVHLGKTSQYKSTYDPTLLVRELRQNNRTHLGIQDNALPFVGVDIWNAYECSYLLNNGCPVTGIVKLSYNCNSKYIVESKSIKLYFNSFNMQKLGPTYITALMVFKNYVRTDLSNLLGVDVKVGFTSGKYADLLNFYPHLTYSKNKYITLEDTESVELELFDTYKEDPRILQSPIPSPYMDIAKEQYFHSGLLKSNCRVTSQPDWGDVYIYIKSNYEINKMLLMKYIVSFRDECHFHEEICECIYKRLHDIFYPSELLVFCLYARRGGIDINPVRASNEMLLTKVNRLIDVDCTHVKTSKQ